MKIIEAIMLADGTARNDIEQAVKLQWLSTVDGLLAREVFDQYEGTEVNFQGYDGETDQKETDLLAPAPWDELYVNYLVMRIYLIQEEIERYNNAALVYAESLRRFENHMNQTHRHKSIRALRF